MWILISLIIILYLLLKYITLKESIEDENPYVKEEADVYMKKASMKDILNTGYGIEYNKLTTTEELTEVLLHTINSIFYYALYANDLIAGEPTSLSLSETWKKTWIPILLGSINLQINEVGSITSYEIIYKVLGSFLGRPITEVLPDQTTVDAVVYELNHKLYFNGGNLVTLTPVCNDVMKLIEPKFD